MEMKILLASNHAPIREGMRHVLKELDDEIILLEAEDCQTGLDLAGFGCAASNTSQINCFSTLFISNNYVHRSRGVCRLGVGKRNCNHCFSIDTTGASRLRREPCMLL